MRKRAVLGKVVGGIILIGAVSAIFLMPPKAAEDPEPEPIRPIKSLIVQTNFQPPDIYFPGMVRAGNSVELSFEVSGRLIEFPVEKSQKVKKGQLLGKLDPRDFENKVKNAQAEADRAKNTFKRMDKAIRSNAISQEEYSRAKADLDKAEATLQIEKKALENSVLVAPFDGIVANSFADCFDMVNAMKPVLTLQDVKTVLIDVSVPEAYIISNTKAGSKKNYHFVIFDALPNRRFPVTFKEFQADADPRTQTYLATFQMPAQKDLTLLPGMSASLVFKGGKVQDEKISNPCVPSDAVAIDSQKKHFVWLMTPSSNNCFTVHKQLVEIGIRTQANMEVTKGLKQGDRIAIAGIMLLREGRMVRLLPEDSITKSASNK